MTKPTDDELDAALRAWGAEQRHRDTRAAAPAVSDLMAGRRRRYTFTAVAASVVLVAALALGLSLGLNGHPAPSADRRSATSSSSPSDHRPCWQQFADAGSQFADPGNRVIVVLRYTGASSCSIADQARLALIDQRGTVVGSSQPRGTRQLIRPDQTVRFSVTVPVATCSGAVSGAYRLLVQLSPATNLQRSTSAEIGPANLDFAPAGCARPASTTRLEATSAVDVVGVRRSATLARLTRIARHESAAGRDPSARAEAVYASNAQIRDQLLVAGKAAPPGGVWTIQLSGHFFVSRGRLGGRGPGGFASNELIAVRVPGFTVVNVLSTERRYTLLHRGKLVPLIP